MDLVGDVADLQRCHRTNLPKPERRGHQAKANTGNANTGGGRYDRALLEWLRRFDRASSRLSESAALELRQELVDHLAADLGPAPSHAAVLDALGHLGLPEDVVDEAVATADPLRPAGGHGGGAASTAAAARDPRRLGLYELGTAFAFLAAVPVLTSVALGRRAVRRPFPVPATAPAGTAQTAV